MTGTMNLIALILLGTLVLASGTAAQDHGGLSDQQACYQQAKQFVADKNASGFKTGPNDDSHFTLSQAHYDPKTKVCYAQVDRLSPVYPAESSLQAYVEMIEVVDAFEGKNIASFVDSYSVDKDGGLKHVAPSECQVNGEKCSERAVFNHLLWKFIPAFRPVNAQKVD